MFYMPDTVLVKRDENMQKLTSYFQEAKHFLKRRGSSSSSRNAFLNPTENTLQTLTDFTGPKFVPSSVAPLSVNGNSTLSVT